MAEVVALQWLSTDNWSLDCGEGLSLLLLGDADDSVEGDGVRDFTLESVSSSS